MADNHPSWDRDPNTDEFLDARVKEIFSKICETTDIDSYMDDRMYSEEREKRKQGFITTKSFDSYEPTCTVVFTFKRIVEAGQTADYTIKSLENSIILC